MWSADRPLVGADRQDVLPSPGRTICSLSHNPGQRVVARYRVAVNSSAPVHALSVLDKRSPAGVAGELFDPDRQPGSRSVPNGWAGPTQPRPDAGVRPVGVRGGAGGGDGGRAGD